MHKTRYLQLSDIMMLEYNMLGETGGENTNINDLYLIKTKDEHYGLFCPSSYEIENDGDGGYKKMFNPKSLNTINHLTVPKDKSGSLWYMFLDSDYKYCTSENYYDFYSSDFNLDYNDDFDKDDACTDLKINEYAKHLDYIDGGAKYKLYSDIVGLRSDSVRLYFVNGYDFSNIYGLTMRVYLNLHTTDGFDKYVDLCNFAVTRNNAYILTSYLSSPIIFGNNIYDRYIEVKLPCIYDMMVNNNSDVTIHEFYNDINVIDRQTVKLQFTYIMEDDVTVSDVEVDTVELVKKTITSRPVNCLYSNDSILKGTIPTENINSDNIGVYIAESPDLPYIEFYGTWKDQPLTKDIVHRFNRGIVLYDKSLVMRDYTYEVDDDYKVEYNLRKWVAMHEIKCYFCNNDNILKEETYSMSQIFVNDEDDVKFYYRPLIFDERLSMDVNHIKIVYNMRLVNVDDKVQFLKTATLAIEENNTMKYYAKGTTLGFSDTRPIKVYNKIMEGVQPVNVKQNSTKQTTKYVKVYYDSSNVTLYENGTGYVPYSYILNMSQLSKTYKFIFRNTTGDGKYSMIDLSNGSYKLAFKDNGGNMVTIEPTYSNNMNLYLGELEFEITTGHVDKLQNVQEGDRKMSIVSYGENGYMSSMYDFMYKI